MPVSHPETVRSQIADLVCKKVDDGGKGSIVFQDAESNAVATLTFAGVAFGDADAGKCIANTIEDDTECVGGIVASFVVKNVVGDICFGGSVTAPDGGGDIILSSTSIGEGDTISISALTYEAPN